MRKPFLFTSLLVALSACDLSPDFKLPEIFSGEAFKETAPVEAAASAATVAPADAGQWKRVDEKAKITEVAWWRMFNLPGLDALEEQAMKENPSLKVAAQRLAAARAEADISEASLFPALDAGFGPKRQKPAAADINASFRSNPPTTTKPYTSYTAQALLTYELDLFGKNRNTARAAAYMADAAENRYRAARLSLQAEIAQAYFQYAALSMESDILAHTIKGRQQTRDLTAKKRDAGAIDDLVLSRAETELATAQADRSAVEQQRAIAEHTLAILVGAPPNLVTVKGPGLTASLPTVPAGLPSSLLERRPDIQAAAQDIAAANARIGAARAGFLPDISLSAVGGFTSLQLHDLFKKPNEFWSIGPLAGSTVLTQPIFHGGILAGGLAERRAEYEGAVANYRVSVLQAFKDVEDSLSGLRNLSDQATANAEAVRASKRSFDVATARYDVGYSSNLDKLDAERSYLAAQRGEVQVLGARYIQTVQLIKALGGSWQAAPAAKQTTPATPQPATPPTPAPEAGEAPTEKPLPTATEQTPNS